MFQSLDLKEINEGSLISIFNLIFLVLEYDFYLDSKSRQTHTFVLLHADKVISWYSSHNLNDIINISGDYNEQNKSKNPK